VRRMEAFYAGSPHPWGSDADAFVVGHADALLPATVLDLGAGDGRNALFLARRGFRVVAVDLVEAALSTLHRRAADDGLAIETHRADIADFPLVEAYANVVSTVTLHFLAWDDAVELVSRAKEQTAPGGLHLLSLFTRTGRCTGRARPRSGSSRGGCERSTTTGR
jgi:tellurite methyltransferase